MSALPQRRARVSQLYASGCGWRAAFSVGYKPVTKQYDTLFYKSVMKGGSVKIKKTAVEWNTFIGKCLCKRPNALGKIGIYKKEQGSLDNVGIMRFDYAISLIVT